MICAAMVTSSLGDGKVHQTKLTGGSDPTHLNGIAAADRDRVAARINRGVVTDHQRTGDRNRAIHAEGDRSATAESRTQRFFVRRIDNAARLQEGWPEEEDYRGYGYTA